MGHPGNEPSRGGGHREGRGTVTRNLRKVSVLQGRLEKTILSKPNRNTGNEGNVCDITP